jgi:hypothetical protein
MAVSLSGKIRSLTVVSFARREKISLKLSTLVSTERKPKPRFTTGTLHVRKARRIAQ